MIPFKTAYLAAVGVLFAYSSQAVLITTPTGNNLIDFSQFASQPYFDFIPGPVTIGEGVQWSAISDSPFNSFVGIGNSYLGENGLWNAGRNGHVGLGIYGGSMSFTFATPVSSVGGFMNYAPGTYGSIPDSITQNQILSVYDVNGALIESINLVTGAPIFTPGGVNAGAFRGFQENSPIIARFEITGFCTLVDDFQFSAVPEPATWLAGLSTLSLMGWFGVKNRRQS